MTFYLKRVLIITAALLLSACSMSVKTGLEKDMAGKDIKTRLVILEEACTTHAGDHHDRMENSDNGSSQYKLPGICHAMSTKIVEATGAEQPQSFKKGFSGLIAQCYEEGKHVQYYKMQTGKTRPGTPTWPFYNLDNERALTQDTEDICSLYQKEFDAVLAGKSK